MEKVEHLIEKFKSMCPSGGFWQNGNYILSNEDENKLKDLHKEILSYMLNNPDYSQVGVRFSVCGWSEKHAYFRNKFSTHKTLIEAKDSLKSLKQDPVWRIPTLIVKETWLLSETTFITFLDILENNEPRGFSDIQEIIKKSMCGNRSYRWVNLRINEERVSY